MRLILLILLLCSFGADAQMIIKAHANYRPYAQPAANLLLDDYPNAAAAYSLRKLRTAYTGNCIRIRRDSTGQAETDIGFDASGVVDTNAIKDFIRNNQCNIVTWYDQSGNGRNMTQGAALNQPVIKSSNDNIVRRNNKPSIFFSTAESDRLSVSRILSNDDFSIFGVVGLNAIQTGRAILAQHSGEADLGRTVFLRTGDGLDNDNAGIFFNNGTSYSAVTTNTYTIATPPVLSLFESESNNLGTTTIKLNGAGTGTISGQTWTPLNTNTTMGAFGNGNNAMNGGISEIIIYSTKQANADGIRNNINDYYNIYWNGDFTGILDTYPNSAAAYSLRNLSSTYKGPLIRVRRSNDNAEQDIFGDYYGNLDTIGLKNFIGANNAAVTTWYDQSGSGNNFTNTTAANQPRIAASGVLARSGGELCVDFGESVTNTSWWLNSPADFLSTTSTPLFLTAVWNIIDFASSNAAVFAPGTQNSLGLEILQHSVINRRTLLRVNNVIKNDNAGEAYQLWNNNTQTNTSILITSSVTEAYKNSSAVTLTNTTGVSNLSNLGSPPNNIYSMGRYATTFDMRGQIHEMIFWRLNQSSNRTGIESNINTYYSIY